MREIEAELVEVIPSTRRRQTAGDSATVDINDNWSGIGLLPQPNARWLSVTGRWTIPSVRLPYPFEPVEGFKASVWVGIDGDNSPDVFRAGVQCELVTTPFGMIDYFYTVWWEWFPHVEVHVNNLPVSPGDVLAVFLRANDIYQSIMLDVQAVFKEQPPDTGTWCMADFDKDGKADLIFIKTANTPSGKVEVHVASAKSQYQDLVFEMKTAFDLQPSGSGTWCMADLDKDGKADLIFIKTANTPSGKVEVHVATAKSQYQDLIIEMKTAFDLQPPGTGTWCMADFDKDSKADLIFIKTANTLSGRVEVHVASAKSQYQDLIFEMETAFDLQPLGTGTWCMADFDKDGKADLIFIKTEDTRSSMIRLRPSLLRLNRNTRRSFCSFQLCSTYNRLELAPGAWPIAMLTLMSISCSLKPLSPLAVMSSCR